MILTRNKINRIFFTSLFGSISYIFQIDYIHGVCAKGHITVQKLIFLGRFRAKGHGTVQKLNFWGGLGQLYPHLVENVQEKDHFVIWGSTVSLSG